MHARDSESLKEGSADLGIRWPLAGPVLRGVLLDAMETDVLDYGDLAVR